MLPRLAIAAVLSLTAGALLGAVDATIGGFGAGSAAEFTLILAAASAQGCASFRELRD